MYSVTRSYEFSAAHRLKEHKKCSRLHGHNYGVKVTVSDTILDDKGMVIDFGALDKIVNPIIEKMDHMYLQPAKTIRTPGMAERETFRLPTEHSTAEYIAWYICEEVRFIMPSKLVIKVEVAENQRSTATYVSSK